METKVCQACGVPLDGETASDNEMYCKWCWADGKYVGAQTIDEMIEVCVPHMGMEEVAARELLKENLPKLAHWRVA